MVPILRALVTSVVSLVRSRVSLQVEILALRHQLMVYERSIRRPRVRACDRILWSWLAGHWSRWREVLVFVQPATVLAWQRRRFREHWARLSRRKTPGRPAVSQELPTLLRHLSIANPREGSPRILGELRTRGIAVAKSPIEKDRGCPPPTALSLRAGVPEEPHCRDRRPGLLHGSDGQPPGALRADRAGA